MNGPQIKKIAQFLPIQQLIFTFSDKRLSNDCPLHAWSNIQRDRKSSKGSKPTPRKMFSTPTDQL